MRKEEAPSRLGPPDPRIRWVFALGLVPAHLLLVSFTVGLRFDHLVLDGVSIALLFVGGRVAQLAVMALPLWMVGALYEALPIFLPLRGEVHVADLYFAERALFGIEQAGKLVTPTEWAAAHLHPVFDALAGFAYLAYLAETFGFAVYLYFKRPERMGLLVWGFLAVNVAGMITYILYPAAPPWYVDQYGLGPAVMDAAPSAARTARFDELFGVSVFASFYSRNVNVFGAMPSLHCAYPTLVFWVARPMGRGLAVAAGGFALWVGLAAVYLNHHYVLDVLAGVAYGCLAYALVSAAMRRRAIRPAAAVTALAVEP